MAAKNEVEETGSTVLVREAKDSGVEEGSATDVDNPEAEQEIRVTVDEGYERSSVAADKASEINRQLAFAGIAIIWVFKVDAGGGRQIVPPELFLPGLFLVLSLGFDLLHYVLKSEIWYRLTRSQEKKLSLSFTVQPWVNYPGDLLYWLKIIVTVSAYVFLVRFLVRQLF